jgi:HSP20 family protein
MYELDAMLPFTGEGDLADAVRRLLDDLDRARPLDRRLPPGLLSPTLDAVETDQAVEILVDVPGLTADDVRVLIKGSVLIIAGGKGPSHPAERADASFHLVERDFGRFVRAIRLNGAFRTTGTTATISRGELRVSIPKTEERRGREIVVPVQRASST